MPPRLVPHRPTRDASTSRCAEEVQRGVHVLALTGHRDALAWLPIGVTGVAVVEGQRGDARQPKCCSYWRSIMSCVAPETMDEDDGGVRAGAGGQGQPRRTPGAAGVDVDALGRDRCGHCQLLNKYGVRISYGCNTVRRTCQGVGMRARFTQG